MASSGILAANLTSVQEQDVILILFDSHKFRRIEMEKERAAQVGPRDFKPRDCMSTYSISSSSSSSSSSSALFFLALFCGFKLLYWTIVLNSIRQKNFNIYFDEKVHVVPENYEIQFVRYKFFGYEKNKKMS
ncbi:hypothetical protein HYC85_007601 [Camellia sinensis]|uniref:Uncharacterized protein n=1 Tax=Camellia sinensis TaxID=4442 RepID=A0A7J7HQ82_CAMSI|nr:hypothetical protein HYC85_007601 [Camellia sinensis]